MINSEKKKKYHQDIAFLMSKERTNGADLWSGEGKHIGKGSPFSTRDIALMLIELGFYKNDKTIKELAELIFEHQRSDGRFSISSTGAIYPCHTIGCFRVLCYLGYANDQRLQPTVNHLLASQEADGGWKCNKFSYGRGPETVHSNPGPTLEALDAFRFFNRVDIKEQLGKAVEFLLWHWQVKYPVGPCLYGMGTLFNKIEYPFFRYNLFYYTYVLSFYGEAIGDARFSEALTRLKSKLQNDMMVVENPNRKLATMEFCFKCRGSELATEKYNEILVNVG